MAEHPKRKRAMMACGPCKERKRKCNGENPCDTCNHFDYECYYDLNARRKRTTGVAPPVVDPSQHHPSVSAHLTNPLDSRSHIRSLEANSGAAFVRRLALKIDPVNAPRLGLFAWNLGAREGSVASLRPIANILTKSEMLALAQVFYDKVDPVYGFIDREAFRYHLDNNWPSLPTNDPYEPVFCGVAALGYLFSSVKAPLQEIEIANRARLLLESLIATASPSVDLVTGCVLRVAYLRMTASPHIAWMASCTAMHMIEAAGLHCEPSPDSVLQLPANNCDPETRRRIFGVAQHLNIWISFDLGRSRVALRGTSSLPPALRPGSVTTEVLGLLPVSESLDPDKPIDAADLELALLHVLDGVYSSPPSVLTQCNLMLCLCRRLRAVNYSIPGDILDRSLKVAEKGVAAARAMLETGRPWHHVAYVPFQVICVLLAIDSRASLSQLGEALNTLGAVAAVYDTDAMKEAYSTARLLILLHQRRKEEDSKTLGGILKAAAAPLGSRSASTIPTPQTVSTADLSWLDDLTTDMPGLLQDLDWNHFLNNDLSWCMPAMNT